MPGRAGAEAPQVSPAMMLEPRPGHVQGSRGERAGGQQVTSIRNGCKQ